MVTWFGPSVDGYSAYMVSYVYTGISSVFAQVPSETSGSVNSTEFVGIEERDHRLEVPWNHWAGLIVSVHA